MKILKSSEDKGMTETWEERSGLLSFLSRVSSEVKRFDSTTGFGLRHLASPPSGIDGDTEIVSKVGFVVLRNNPVIPEKTYCLYTILTGETLQARIGIYSSGWIGTQKELAPLSDFRRGELALYDWLKGLVKASCDK